MQLARLFLNMHNLARFMLSVIIRGKSGVEGTPGYTCKHREPDLVRIISKSRIFLWLVSFIIGGRSGVQGVPGQTEGSR